MASNTAYTGISPESLRSAPPLADAWDKVQHAFRGRYILAYGLRFLAHHLRENANAYNLAPFMLIGSCLMDRAASSYQASVSLHLAEVCRRIGHPFPQPATALDRLTAQRALVIAMSQGVIDVTRTHTGADSTEPDTDDDDPF